MQITRANMRRAPIQPMITASICLPAVACAEAPREISAESIEPVVRPESSTSSPTGKAVKTRTDSLQPLAHTRTRSNHADQLCVNSAKNR